jgi:uncharacterized protein (DUF342 family)
MIVTINEIDSAELEKMDSYDQEGNLIIHGNINKQVQITVTEDIEVFGDINEGKIKSLKGNVFVRGNIKGINTHIQAGKDIEAISVHQATLKAMRNINVLSHSESARLLARNSIKNENGEGIMSGGEIEAGTDIIAQYIGSDKSTATALKLTNFRQAELFIFLKKYEAEIAGINKQLEELSKLIQVIKILGNKVIQLPLEKKQELALKIKKYNELNLRLGSIETEKANLYDKNNSLQDVDRSIIARKTLYAGVTAMIDKAQITIKENFNRVILYKKGIIIVGDYDEFMRRKKEL